MNRYEYSRRYRSRRRKRRLKRATVILGCAALFFICGTGAAVWGKKFLDGRFPLPSSATTASPEASDALPDGLPGGSASPGEELPGGDDQAPDISIPEETGLEGAVPGRPAFPDTPSGRLLAQADLLAAGYDYDRAIEVLQSDPSLASDPDIMAAIAGYEATKATLVKASVSKITHVFFHSLVADNAKAFDGDEDEPGYNQVMTTIGEFNKILNTMYEKGYVLVRLHDMAYETTDENGKTVMKPGTIMLPEGKIPFVMSQDDLCYYPYMDGDGFATRIVIGEDGYPTCEMKMDDGSTATGDYDLVPILERFIQEHPDFSYKGARAVLAFTGYEGILGYRTSSAYVDSPTYEQDRQEAARVAQCLKDHGWELASHSWGHLDLGTVEIERFHADTDKWEDQVDSLIGPVDIILYPFGADVGDWHPYTTENERFNYLYACGFRYFCNVDSNPYWVQIGDNYMRQGRRNLDGYRMWKDITAEDPTKRKLDDLFRAEDVFDPDRPTPVPEM